MGKLTTCWNWQTNLWQSVQKSHPFLLGKIPDSFHFLVGGWTNPFEKIWVKLDHLPHFRDEHNKYLSCHHLDTLNSLNWGVYSTHPTFNRKSIFHGYDCKPLENGWIVPSSSYTFYRWNKLRTFLSFRRTGRSKTRVASRFKEAKPGGQIAQFTASEPHISLWLFLVPLIGGRLYIYIYSPNWQYIPHIYIYIPETISKLVVQSSLSQGMSAGMWAPDTNVGLPRNGKSLFVEP